MVRFSRTKLTWTMVAYFAIILPLAHGGHYHPFFGHHIGCSHEDCLVAHHHDGHPHPHAHPPVPQEESGQESDVTTDDPPKRSGCCCDSENVADADLPCPSEGDDHEHGSLPAHTDDDCPICHFFAQGQLPALPALAPVVSSLPPHAVASLQWVLPAAQRQVDRARGPPALL